VKYLEGNIRLKNPVQVAFGVFLIALSAVQTAKATTQLFVFTDDGIWVASDTLRIHNENGKITPETVCKLVFTPGRIIFNAGGFDDAVAVENVESHLPSEPMNLLEPQLLQILRSHRMTSPNDQGVGIVQVINGKPEASMFEFSWRMQEWIERPILQAKKGLFHGFGGKAFQERAEVSWHNPDQAAAIAREPQVELEKVLQAEVRSRPEEVGRPFSVFLLRNDGTLVDYSTTHVCRVPSSIPSTSAIPQGS
jgi:hypothetical protein